MTATEFLKEKGIIKEGFSSWRCVFEDGKEFVINDLLEEYASQYKNQSLPIESPEAAAAEFFANKVKELEAQLKEAENVLAAIRMEPTMSGSVIGNFDRFELAKRLNAYQAKYIEK